MEQVDCRYLSLEQKYKVKSSARVRLWLHNPNLEPGEAPGHLGTYASTWRHYGDPMLVSIKIGLKHLRLLSANMDTSESLEATATEPVTQCPIGAPGRGR